MPFREQQLDAMLNAGNHSEDGVMELTEAIRQLIPLQVQLPNRRRPLQWQSHVAAEVFLAESKHGPCVIWLDPFWCDHAEGGTHVAYASLRASAERWIDTDPRFGRHCIPYQKPVILERISRGSATWRDYMAWQARLSQDTKNCGRHAAWQRVEADLGDIAPRRLV